MMRHRPRTNGARPGGADSGFNDCDMNTVGRGFCPLLTVDTPLTGSPADLADSEQRLCVALEKTLDGLSIDETRPVVRAFRYFLQRVNIVEDRRPLESGPATDSGPSEGNLRTALAVS